LSRRIDNVIHNALRAAFAKRFDHLRPNAARAPGHKHNFVSEIEIRHFLTEYTKLTESWAKQF
jgi:hypothetical protein